jgi:hypothetical protein
MTDLEIAKSELHEEKLSLAMVKDGSVLYSSKSDPVTSMLEAIDKHGYKLTGASVAVHESAKAFALLCAYANIKEVYSAVISRKALTTFKTSKISVYWNKLSENTKNSDNTASCPFERATANINDPKNAYQTLKKRLLNSKKCL